MKISSRGRTPAAAPASSAYRLARAGGRTAPSVRAGRPEQALAERRHSEVDDRQLERCAAEAAANTVARRSNAPDPPPQPNSEPLRVILLPAAMPPLTDRLGIGQPSPTDRLSSRLDSEGPAFRSGPKQTLGTRTDQRLSRTHSIERRIRCRRFRRVPSERAHPYARRRRPSAEITADAP